MEKREPLMRYAKEIVEKMKEETETDTRGAIRDLLTELRHMCDASGLNFFELDRDAGDVYIEELRIELSPSKDTICECAHWFEEHDEAGRCQCGCTQFVFSPRENTAAAIAARGSAGHQPGCACALCKERPGWALEETGVST